MKRIDQKTPLVSGAGSLSHRRAAQCLLFGVTLVGFAAVTAQSRDEFVRPDLFGYQASTTCPSQFVDVAATGTELTLTDSDDGGAVLDLAASFGFYDQVHQSIVVSSNGYIAFSGSLQADSGNDFSNDCPLPAVPDQGPAVAQRLYVLHDDLEAVGASSTLTTEHFTSCPRSSDSLSDESCTVVQWTGWRPVGSAAAFDAQAILYHSSSDISLQFRNLTSTDVASATIGIQITASAAMSACNRALPTVAPVCISRFGRVPPVAVADSLTVAPAASSSMLDSGALSVVANDTDAEDGQPTGEVNVAFQPSAGTLVLNSDGTFIYTHNGGTDVQDDFGYTVSDSDGTVSNVAHVNIVIATQQNEQLFSDSFERP